MIDYDEVEDFDVDYKVDILILILGLLGIMVD